MSVFVEAIKFNHDPNSATNDALNLRRNGTQSVAVPEWRRGVSVNPEDAPAAYAMRETRNRTLTIQAQFSRSDPSLHTIEVRALDATVPGQPQGCLGLLWWLLRQLVQALFGNVLGEVKARPVTFLPTGRTNFESFQLARVRIWSARVGVYETNWQWQYRTGPGQPWTDMAVTSHRIYVVLELPNAPWQQQPFAAGNLQLPWTEVLDHACRWAMRAGTLDAAAAGVTRAVYDLGPGRIEYDCPGYGSTHYAIGAFNCTAFLERLRGGYGLGRYVNCTDCATITSSFANILGCDLWQSRMGWNFGLNPLLAIGSAVWQTACGWSGFYYHEVAWKGACTANDEVFDACLQVDGDADPTAAPHTPLLPTNLRFGNPGDGQYRDRLATPAGRPNCAPQPGTRTRRAIV